MTTLRPSPHRIAPGATTIEVLDEDGVLVASVYPAPGGIRVISKRDLAVSTPTPITALDPRGATVRLNVVAVSVGPDTGQGSSDPAPGGAPLQA